MDEAKFTKMLEELNDMMKSTGSEATSREIHIARWAAAWAANVIAQEAVNVK